MGTPMQIPKLGLRHKLPPDIHPCSLKNVFVNAPGGNNDQIGHFKYKGPSQGHKVIDSGVIWKGFISWEYMPNMKSISLTV